jgi:hypothetical protein
MKASGAALVNHAKRWSKQKSHLGISACNHHIAMSSTRSEAPGLLWWQCHQHGHLIAMGTIRVLQDPPKKKRQSGKLLNRTKQNKNTTHSIVSWRIQKVLFLYPEVKLSFSKTKLWQIQTALKNSFQGFADSWSKSKIYSTQLSNKLPCAAAWLEEQLGFPELFFRV